MPQFYDLFQEEFKGKQNIWRDRYHEPPKSIGPLMKQEIKKWWVPIFLKTYERSPRDFNVLAIDSSYQMERLKNGGVFYVVRALGINRKNEYRALEADFDYTEGSTHEVTNTIQRKMECLEIKVAREAISDGFNGVVLIDGSLYGRISHLIIESPLGNDREFFIRYYQEVTKFFRLAKENNVLVIGISKESGSQFLRDFLIKQLVTLQEVRGEVPEEEARRLVSMSLDKKHEAFKHVKQLKVKYSTIGLLEDILRELTTPRPDYQLIEAFIEEPGHTVPLLLGPSSRWLRGLRQIEIDPDRYLKTHFPVLSNNGDFINYAKVVLNRLKELPAIISLHILPDKRDSPLRVDVPAFCVGLTTKFQDVGWPEPIEEDISKVLSVVATGYGGLEYHNIWLWSVDKKVKFHRKEFDEMYFSKFKELVGVSLNARDYRRVKLV